MNKCIQELENSGVAYEKIVLTEKVHSVEDVQKACNCRADEVIKTLLFIGEKPVMIILPGDKKADKEKIKAITGESKIKFATPEEVERLTGYKVGSVSPFGVSDAVNQIADESVKKLNTLYLGSGESNSLIIIDQQNFNKAFKGTYSTIAS